MKTRWLLLGQGLWIVLAGAAIVAFRGSLVPWRPAVIVSAIALSGLIFTGFVSLLVLFALLRSGRGGGRDCLIAAALSLPALAGVLVLGLRGAEAPPIHDITTDPGHPPVLAMAQILRGPGDNSTHYPGQTVAERQRQAYPDIVPIETPLPAAQTFVRCLAAARQLRWRIVGHYPEQGVIEAIDRTLIFGFTDDIVIRVTAADGGSRVDLRSASRAGVGDLGVNARRIRAFTHTFNALQSP